MNGAWPSSTVLRMLADERYIGTYVIGKRAVKEIGGTRSRLKDESEWYKIPDHHPAIVDKAIYDKVQASARRFKLPDKKKHEHPLRGKVVCGLCGHAMSRANNAVYHCRHAEIAPDSPCRDQRVRAAELERIIYEVVSTQVEVLAGMDITEAGAKMDVQFAQRARCEEQIAHVQEKSSSFLNSLCAARSATPISNPIMPVMTLTY